MKTREEAIAYGLSFADTYQDAPFHDTNWQLVRYKGNRKAFLWTYEKDGCICLNVKVDPEKALFWRRIYQSVVPGYHQNKDHWNTVILDGSIPDKESRRNGDQFVIAAKPRVESTIKVKNIRALIPRLNMDAVRCHTLLLIVHIIGVKLHDTLKILREIEVNGDPLPDCEVLTVIDDNTGFHDRRIDLNRLLLQFIGHAGHRAFHHLAGDLATTLAHLASGLRHILRGNRFHYFNNRTYRYHHSGDTKHEETRNPTI